MSQNSSILQFRKAHCRNCYKCVRNCPVKSIRVNQQQAQIIDEECILCERCTQVCPQNAKDTVNQIPAVKNAIRAGHRVIASVHPSWIVEYGTGSFRSLSEHLLQLGFARVEEAADAGEDIRAAYRNCLDSSPEKPLVLTSHCPVMVQLVRKHFPELYEHMAPVLSLMQAHGRRLHEEEPDAVIVYISPCIASITECEEPGSQVDYVVTFQELQHWLLADERFVRCEDETEAPKVGRAMALSGGLNTLLGEVPGYECIRTDGLENVVKILGEIHELGADHYQGYFLDMYACSGGCIGGPSFRNEKTPLLESIIGLKKAAFGGSGRIPTGGSAIPAAEDIRELPARVLPGRTDRIPEEVTEEQVKKVLNEMGKLTAEDMLNCGACGYNTCREKAVAVCQGKAEITMCVPYMQERQESYSNKIINAMPGLLVTVDYEMHVVHMNRAAQEFFCMNEKRRIVGEPVGEIMDDDAIIDMIAYRKSLGQDQVEIAINGRILDRVFTNDRKNRLILCIMKDVTKDLTKQHELRTAQMEAAAMADRLVKEQLQIVHKIAGLLGETAADTKVAVEELKRTILMETEKHE